MTRRERILQACYAVTQTLTGIAADSCTRERASALSVDECPAIDTSPEAEAEPIAVGDGVDRRDLTVAFKLSTVGDGAHARADPLVEALHAALFADSTLGALATQIKPGPTDFYRDDADQTIGRTVVRYRIAYLQKRTTLTA